MALLRTCVALKKVEWQRFEAVVQRGEDSTVRVTTFSGDAGPGQLESVAPWNTCLDLPLKMGFSPSKVVKPKDKRGYTKDQLDLGNSVPPGCPVTAPPGSAICWLGWSTPSLVTET